MDAKPREYKPRPGNAQRKAKKGNQTEAADEADAPVKDRDKLPPGSHAITWNFNKVRVFFQPQSVSFSRRGAFTPMGWAAVPC